MPLRIAVAIMTRCPTSPIAPAVLTCPYLPVCPCVPRLLSLCGPTLPIAPAVLTCPLPMCHYTLRLLLLCGPTLPIAPAVLTCPPPPARLPPCVMGHRYVHQPCHSPLNFTIALYTHQPKQLRQAHLAYQSPAPAMPRSSSKRKSNKRQERHTHTRSASPTQTGSSRGRCQSRSPPARENSYTPCQGETRSRDNSRRTRGEHDQFFRSGADSRGAVCATCLGRHEHAFGKCTARKLWNGAAAGAKKNGYGRLVGEDGLAICYDWQLPPGCQSTSHNERHKCSGCGKTSHGAQNCPRAEKE